MADAVDPDMAGALGAPSAAPEWEHFVVLAYRHPEKQKSLRGDPYLKCLHCSRKFWASVNRARVHLSGVGKGVTYCSKAPAEVRKRFLDITREKERVRVDAARKRNLDEATATDLLGSSILSTAFTTEPATQRLRQETLAENAARNDSTTLDAAWALAAFENGWSFNSMGGLRFRRAVAMTATFRGHYKPPSATALRTTLLERAVDQVQKAVDSVREDVPVFGSTIVSDGWTNTANVPTLNFLQVRRASCKQDTACVRIFALPLWVAYVCYAGWCVQHRLEHAIQARVRCMSAQVVPKGAVFLDAEDTTGEVKDAAYICEQLCSRIESVQSGNVLHVVMDNAPVCKAAGQLVTEKYPHILCSPDPTHGVDLFFEDIAKLDWVKPLLNKAKKVNAFITNHHATLALFRAKSTLQLLKPGDTRFGTNFIMLERLCKVQEALERTVTDAAFTAFLDRSDAATVAKGERVKAIVLNRRWQTNANKLVEALEPCFKLLRLFDGDAPAAPYVLQHCQAVLDGLKACDLAAAKRQQLAAAFEGRWEFFHSPLHYAGFALNPANVQDAYVGDEQVVEGLMQVLEKWEPVAEVQGRVLAQFAAYRSQVGLFARECVKAAAHTLLPYAWWRTFGGTTPDLQQFAVKVCGMCVTSSSCERNWSTFDFIHTKSRNRLTSQRLRDLVFVHFNLRLLDKAQNLDSTAVTVDE